MAVKTKLTTLEQEAQQRLRKALRLKAQIEKLQAQLDEHKQWFVQHYPKGYECPYGQAIVRWTPDFRVEVDKLLKHLDVNGLRIALQLAGVRHTVVARLKERGVLPADLADKLVVKVGERPSVEFRRE